MRRLQQRFGFLLLCIGAVLWLVPGCASTSKPDDSMMVIEESESRSTSEEEPTVIVRARSSEQVEPSDEGVRPSHADDYSKPFSTERVDVLEGSLHPLQSIPVSHKADE